MGVLGLVALAGAVPAGSTQVTLRLQALPAGLYEVRYFNANQRLTTKVSRQ